MHLKKKNLNGRSLRNCTEFFGLSKSGKTTLLKRFPKNGREIVNWKSVSDGDKISLFLRYLIGNLSNVFYLFYEMNRNWIVLKDLRGKDYWTIFKMRNSYLASVLAKYQYIREKDFRVLTDEFFLQSIFMILHKKASIKKIRELFTRLAVSNKLVLVEEPSKVRYRRLSNIKKFSRNLDKKFKMVWWKNMEYNYEIVRKLIFEEYTEVK